MNMNTRAERWTVVIAILIAVVCIEVGKAAYEKAKDCYYNGCKHASFR